MPCRLTKARACSRRHGHRLPKGATICLPIPRLRRLRERTAKASGKWVLRWLAQRGVASVAKSVRPERMAENQAIWDFELSEAEMRQITAMDTATSAFFSHRDPERIKWLAGREMDV